MNLSLFIRQQLDGQQLSVKEFAARSGLGLSHTYQLLRGERRKGVTTATMDAIARGLSMTPAEMAVLMGRAAVAVPDELERFAIVRQISPEDWPAAKKMLLGLVAVNTASDTAANPPGTRSNGRRRALRPPFTSGKRDLVLAAWASIQGWFSPGVHVPAISSAATA